MYTGELFDKDDADDIAIKHKLYVDVTSLKPEWKKIVDETLEEATIEIPDDDQFMYSGSRKGRHTEHLGPLLAQMQFLRRSQPDAEWK
jgi:ring-1,2-phenylacetyl-CoA epoxidase subunit PaaC